MADDKKTDGTQEKDPLEEERSKLVQMQKDTMQLADACAAKCLTQLLLLGFTFGAGIDPETKEPTFLIRALTLEEWQEIAKAKVRDDLNPLKKGRGPTSESGIIL